MNFSPVFLDAENAPPPKRNLSATNYELVGFNVTYHVNVELRIG